MNASFTAPTEGDVVLLLGWTGQNRALFLVKSTNTNHCVLSLLGGGEKLIQKAYADRYLALGLHCIMVLTPIPPLEARDANREFGKIVSTTPWTTLVDGRRKVVAHAFSNGGAINLTHFIRVTADGPNPLSACLSGLIFDSVPGINSSQNIAEFTLSTTLPKGGLDAKTRTPFKVASTYAWAFPRMLSTEISHLWWDLKQTLGFKGDVEDMPFWTAVYEMFLGTSFPNVKAVKFLYSKRDRLTDYRAVEEVMAQMKSRFEKRGNSAPITGRLFEASEHVAHASVYPREYWTDVSEVMEPAGFSTAGQMRNIAESLGAKAKL
jgi:hypothetical protein